MRRNRGSIVGEFNQPTQRKSSGGRSMLIMGSTTFNIIQFNFGGGDVDGRGEALPRNLDSRDALSLYNFFYSIFSYSLRVFNNSSVLKSAEDEATGTRRSCLRSESATAELDIVVVVNAARLPMKALRILLRACQTALAYKIKQAVVVVESERSFISHQRVGLELLLDAYNFKTVICPKSKLWKYLEVNGGALYEFNDTCRKASYANTLPSANSTVPRNVDDWLNVKKEFQEYYTNGGPTCFGSCKAANILGWPDLVLTTTSASLSKFLKKDHSIVIELRENPTDNNNCNNGGSVTLRRTSKQKTRKMSATESILGLMADNYSTLIRGAKMRRGEPSEDSRSDIRRNSTCEENRKSIDREAENDEEFRRRLDVAGKCEVFEKKSGSAPEMDSASDVVSGSCVEVLLDAEFLMRCTKSADELRRVADEILGWIEESGEPLLRRVDSNHVQTTMPCWELDDDSTLHSDLFSARDHRDLIQATEEVMDKCATLNEGAENLRHEVFSSTAAPSANDELAGQMRAMDASVEEAQRRVFRFWQRVHKQTLKIENCRRFRVAVAKFYKDSDNLLKSICCEHRTALDKSAIDAEMTSLKDKMSVVEERLNVVIEAGTTFCTVLRNFNVDDADGPDACGSLAVDEVITEEDASSASTTVTGTRESVAQRMEFVADNLTAVTERRRRCGELVKLRIQRLKQLEEIIRCEAFGNQIIEKMNECLECLADGRPATTILVNNRKTEKRLYNYAKHLNHTALVLRRLHGHGVLPNTVFHERIEAVWRKLNHRN